MSAQSSTLSHVTPQPDGSTDGPITATLNTQAFQGVPSTPSDLVVWFDTARAEGSGESVLSRLAHTRYTGVVFYASEFRVAESFQSIRLTRIVDVRSRDELEELCARPLFRNWIETSDLGPVIASSHLDVLAAAAAKKLRTCFRVAVNDATSLHASIDLGRHHDFVMIKFRDTTNIPLELVIASLQGTDTVLIKEIEDPNNVDDAIVSLGVMEVGADGVMFSPHSHTTLDAFLNRLASAEVADTSISVGTVLRSTPIGMGHRSCLDLTTLFSSTEGMLVGSTSQGGILCCPEVFFLPYMELRPFRINAGAVHSYVYNARNRTDYMTELKAGSPVMVSDIHGTTRKAIIGRVKTEVRPLRLIEVEFPDNKVVNVIMQDDWHVRIFSAQGLPLNITDLKVGDPVLGHVAAIGRHVGISVDEQIIER